MEGRQEYVADVASYGTVETVEAVAEMVDGDLVWRYAHEVRLRAGDAIENPPTKARVGERVTLRIIRGYDRMRPGAQA